ncbi:hypothetical protein TWF281_003842 [Arthrobotrys megalospora]
MSGKEATFRTFTKDQGQDYARYRRDYHSRLYQQIIDYHTSKSGQLGTLLDIGCGPGIAVRTFAKQFTHAIGIDASEGMITTAKSLGGETSTSEPIRFEVSADYGASLDLPDGSVDVITVATAAHWFDMRLFWTQAARLLKPGGTVALWTGANIVALPPTPNPTEITAAINRLMDRIDDFKEEGNRISQELYINLAMPWTLDPPVVEFEKSEAKRVEWGTDTPESLPCDEFFAMNKPANLDMVEAIVATASPVIRWREANPELAGTDQDVVKRMRREMEETMRAGGVNEGEELLYGGVDAVLLLNGKKA